VTDICVFAFFFPSLFLVLAFRVFVFYIILKKRVVDRGCAVALAGECTVPGSVFSLSVFSGAFLFCFVFVSMVFVSSQHLSISLWLVGKRCLRNRDIHWSFNDCMFSAAFGVISVDFVLGFLSILLVCFSSIVVFRFPFTVVFSATEPGVARQY